MPLHLPFTRWAEDTSSAMLHIALALSLAAVLAIGIVIKRTKRLTAGPALCLSVSPCHSNSRSVCLSLELSNSLSPFLFKYAEDIFLTRTEQSTNDDVQTDRQTAGQHAPLSLSLFLSLSLSPAKPKSPFYQSIPFTLSPLRTCSLSLFFPFFLPL